MNANKVSDEVTGQHPQAIAWDKWLASDQGQRSSEPNACLSTQREYLENRLAMAFQAGWDACDSIASPTTGNRHSLIKRLFKTGLTNIQIARCLEISRERVRQLRVTLGFSPKGVKQ